MFFYEVETEEKENQGQDKTNENKRKNTSLSEEGMQKINLTFFVHYSESTVADLIIFHNLHIAI